MKTLTILILFLSSSSSFANNTWLLKKGSTITATQSFALLPEVTEYYFFGNKVYPSSELDIDVEKIALYCFLIVSGGHKNSVPVGTTFTTYFSTQNESSGDVAVALQSNPRISFISAIACRDQSSYEVPTLSEVKEYLKYFFSIKE